MPRLAGAVAALVFAVVVSLAAAGYMGSHVYRHDTINLLLAFLCVVFLVMAGSVGWILPDGWRHRDWFTDQADGQ